MAVLYIKEQGSCVQKCGERIIVTKGRRELLDIPVMSVETIALFGNVQMTTQLLHFLMEQGVDVSYFSVGGKYIGQAAAETSKNIFVRFAQYERYLDMESRLAMARIIVRNKGENQLAMLEQFRWDRVGEAAPEQDVAVDGYDWRRDVEQIRAQLDRLDQMETANQLLGAEGMCSNIYFHSFAHMFHGKVTFPGRNRRPPRDPINVILSLGYTFLTREVSSALEAQSFEMYLGFLHGIRYGRKSLPLDMMEEFRQPIIDRLVLRLFNKRILNEFHFEDTEDAVALNEEGFQIFCKEYERWMTDKAYADGRKNFRGIIREQAQHLKTAIQKREEYHPFCWKASAEAASGEGSESGLQYSAAEGREQQEESQCT